MRRWTVDVVATLAPLLIAGLAACGSSDAPSGSTPKVKGDTADRAREQVDVCAIATPADAGEIFGEAAKVRDATQSEPLISGICIYTAASDEFAVRHLLQLRVYEGSEFYGKQLFPDADPLEGLGDKAFVSVNEAAHMVDVQFVIDGRTGIVNYTGDASADLAPKVETIEKLAAKLAQEM